MIAEYLRTTAPSEFVWGQNDCGMWAVGLMQKTSGLDPAADVRGSYSTWNDCRNVMMEYGGLRAMVLAIMPEPTGETENGICLASVGGKLVCGILCEGRLFLKTRRGVVSPEVFEIVEGWSLCHKQ